MINRERYNKVKESLNLVSEHINKIAENTTLEELETKLDTIIDALGLDVTETKDKKEDDTIEIEDDVTVNDKESSTEDEEDTTVDNKEPSTEDEDDTFTVDESLNTKVKPYSIQFMDSRAYETDIDKIKDKFTSANSIDFDSLDELVSFLGENGFIRYADVSDVYDADSAKESGLLYMTGWYEIVKNKVDSESEQVIETV